MAGFKFTKFGGAAVLALAVAGLATPAFAQDDDGGRGGGREAREAREAPGTIGDQGGDRGGRGWRNTERAAPAPAATQSESGRSWRRAEAAAPAPVAAPAEARGWRGGDSARGDGGRGDGGRGWGSQRAPAGTYGRDWSTGTVERPAPAQPAPAAASSERGRDARRGGSWSGRGGETTSRDRGYVDPARGTTYRDASRERHGDDWRDGDHRDGSTWRSGSGSRDGYRDSDRRGETWRGTSDRRSGYSSGDRHRWDRDWRHDRRYDWNSYRRTNRSVFNLGIYYSPYRSYSYRRLSIGFFLDSLFYSSRYWIQDPWRYRLPEVYGPYRWVRYYDDALLVDIYSGEVVDVIHDFFW